MEYLVSIPIAEFDDLIPDRRAIARSNALNGTRISPIGRDWPGSGQRVTVVVWVTALDLLYRNLPSETKTEPIVVRFLHIQRGPVDGTPIKPRWRPGLSAPSWPSSQTIRWSPASVHAPGNYFSAANVNEPGERCLWSEQRRCTHNAFHPPDDATDLAVIDLQIINPAGKL